METSKMTFYDILMWGLVFGAIGFAGHVFTLINTTITTMQAL